MSACNLYNIPSGGALSSPQGKHSINTTMQTYHPNPIVVDVASSPSNTGWSIYVDVPIS
jgi:hypothetical protein